MITHIKKKKKKMHLTWCGRACWFRWLQMQWWFLDTSSLSPSLHVLVFSSMSFICFRSEGCSSKKTALTSALITLIEGSLCPGEVMPWGSLCPMMAVMMMRDCSRLENIGGSEGPRRANQQLVAPSHLHPPSYQFSFLSIFKLEKKNIFMVRQIHSKL